MQIEAAVMRDSGSEFSVEKIELREPQADEVLVRIVGAGMCHTDFAAREAPTGALQLPLVLGHEGAGIVEQIGPHVTQANVGDHVILSYDSCGWCPQCLTGTPSYCNEFATRNFAGIRNNQPTHATDTHGNTITTGWFGQSSFATYSLATQRNIVKVDKDLPLEKLGPLGCGIQTGAGAILNALNVRHDSTVAIYGTGAVGLAAIMAAKLTGATTIIAIDTNPTRLTLAQQLGATHTLNGNDPDLTTQIQTLTHGGTTHALDTTGNPTAITTALTTLQPLGNCGLVAGGQPLQLHPQTHLNQGRTATFLLEGNAIPQLFLPQLIQHWQNGNFPFDKLITTYPLHHINQAKADALTGKSVKPVLIP